CGLVSIRQQGRERICEARLQKLSEVDRWVSQYRDFWNAKLDALGEHLEIMKREKARTTKSGKRIPATK
ncbi:MAG TPA: transcriptional regulator, partial [Chitinophagaceae bacterium]